MKPTTETIYVQALELSPEDRAALADRLLESIHGPTDPAIESAWAAEAEDRLAAYRRGEIPSIPAEEVFQSIQDKASAKKAQ